MTDLEITNQKAGAIARSAELVPSNNPMHLIEAAVTNDAPLDKLEKLMDLQERWEANEARKAFHKAMAGFRSESIKITKTRQVTYQTQAGGQTSYSHAELGSIVEAVIPALSRHGLSHHWETDQKDARIYVTCVLTHEQGHSEKVTLNASPDDSGKKNAIQSIGSTITYLQRYTFLAVTGLAAQGQDDDGQASGDYEPLIDDSQISKILALCEETGTAPTAITDWLGVPALEDIGASAYERALLQLQRKKAKKAAEA